jgi:hypothetical protein
MVPLLWLATTRHRNWIAKIHVSHKVMFHSATLVLVGLYLLFMASVGYYVRYFGGAWAVPCSWAWFRGRGAGHWGGVVGFIARHAAGVSGQAFFSLPL